MVVQSPKDQNLSSALKEVYKSFLKGDFVLAESQAINALSLDYDSQEVQDTLLCAKFWKERWNQLTKIVEVVFQADYLFTEYQGFRGRFVSKFTSSIEEGLHSLRQCVLGRCLSLYDQIKTQEGPRLETLLRLAKCHKTMGEYDLAISSLEQTNRLFKDEAEVLAEMADCYEMISENRLAKVLFREAFYINPQKIDLTFLESPMIRKLLETMGEHAHTAIMVKEWIPVYGVLKGVFNIKRELKPMELAQLKQGIHSLRNELQSGKKENNPLLPRLINKYFWLIDHYQATKEDRIKIEELLLNIKILDPLVFNLYTN